MKNNLLDIKTYVQKLAEVISEVLRVDVEVVNTQFARIAGTGRYSGSKGSSTEGEVFIYKKVIETGKKQVIENPGFHKLCQNCPKRNSCLEKFEYCTPIISDGSVIGVISLICYTEGQKKIIISKFKEYFDFLDRISELIASKASEAYYLSQKENLSAELKSIINYIQDNVLVIDEEGRTLFYNEKLRNFLERHFKSIDDINQLKVNISDYGERVNINNFTSFNLNIGSESRRVLGYVNDIGVHGDNKSRIIIFQDMKSFQKVIYEHSESNRIVDFNSIIGVSSILEDLKEKCISIAAGHASVLITGESGTGKELFARAIHNESKRFKGPFIAINCGAIPDSLLESELFGYVPGAFTGASKNGKIGKFELAGKGTIFLDEIGDMPLHLQVKLLRVLQDKVVIPIGSNKPIPINVRIISATNKPLEKMVKSGEFREDLFYRLNVIPIEIPPLRERTEDIPVLVEHFLKKYCSYYEINVPQVSDEVMSILKYYSWKGNVRELENTIEYIVNVLQNSEIIQKCHLPDRIIVKEDYDKDDELNLEMIEKKTIVKAINKFGGNTENKKKVARALGISLATLYRKMDKYDITKNEEWVEDKN